LGHPKEYSAFFSKMFIFIVLFLLDFEK